MAEQFNYRQQTRSSSDQIEARQRLIELFQSTPLPSEQLMVNLGHYIRSGAIAKFLFLDELYRQIVRIPGDVVEFGTWWTQSLATFLNLRAIYEHYRPRKIIGFDTFKGYLEPSDRDRRSETIKIWGYRVSSN